MLDYAYNMNRAIPAFNPDGSRYLYQRASSGSMPMYAFNVLNEMDNSGDETNGSTPRPAPSAITRVCKVSIADEKNAI